MFNSRAGLAGEYISVSIKGGALDVSPQTFIARDGILHNIFILKIGITNEILILFLVYVRFSSCFVEYGFSFCAILNKIAKIIADIDVGSLYSIHNYEYCIFLCKFGHMNIMVILR